MRAGRLAVLFGVPWVAALYPNCRCGPGLCVENPNASIDKRLQVSEEDGPLALPAEVVEAVALHVAVARTDVEMPYALVEVIALTPNLPPNTWSIPMVHDDDAVRFESVPAPAEACSDVGHYPFSTTFGLVYADRPDEPVDAVAYPPITVNVASEQGDAEAHLWNGYGVHITLVDRIIY